MAEITNLTDRLVHIRDKKNDSVQLTDQSDGADKQNPHNSKISSKERKLATDYFMLFVYILLGMGIVSQLALIAWLDIY